MERGARVSRFAPIALAALDALTGCATLVEPPAAPVDPVAVVLVDWGWHSSLLLPATGGYTEYAFGEWEWFALGNDGWWRVPAVLFWPRAGALGRRDWPAADPVAASAEATEVLLVARAASEALRGRLELVFATGAAARAVVEGGGLEFVPVDDTFWLGHTCNAATAEWLRALGCRVSGPTVTARFDVEAEPAR